MSISIKNAQEIESMRKGGKILAQILHTLEQELKPGMSTMDLERRAAGLFKEFGVKPGFKGYHGYPYILCTSVNNEVVHTFPNEQPLEEGDILSVDCGVILDGLNTDSAVAMVVGGKTLPQVQHFVDTCKRAMWAGIKQVRPGNHVGDIGHAISRIVQAEGYTVVPELTGHGIGYTLHEDPYVPNYGKPGQGPRLEAGMCIAIEPIIVTGSPKIVTLEDDWTIVTADGGLGIQHEHTILITEDGYEVLTLRPGEKPL